MAPVAVIGGTGLSSLASLQSARSEVVNTPYGEPSAPLVHGVLGGREVVFLARHGLAHAIPPHKVNYRANIRALKQLGVHHVIAVAAVGGIHPDLVPGRLAFPDQIVDYTWGRAHTFFEEDLERVVHVDFTEPYCAELRQVLVRAARSVGAEARERGTYGATQGPRLESSAEIDRLERDGCDMVGMTGMPEAALARELDLCYATCAVVANAAAGRGEGKISLQSIESALVAGMGRAGRVLEHAVALLE